MTALDDSLRRHVYDFTLARGLPPTIDELCAAVSSADRDVRLGLHRLAAGRVLVLQPESSEILMAPPFSAAPTPFVVEASRHTSFANCAWDALGVPVMLGEPATIAASCACCGESITLDISLDHPPEATSVIHFAVPAARWWQDIVFT